jgi:GGDEF domain-containing protein
MNSKLPAVKELHALQDLYRTLDNLAYTDPLTLLPNRVQFRDYLERHTVRDRRQHAGFALLLLDLDGFKQINDRFGHQAGDQLLHQVARRLAGVMRHGDVISLLGEMPDMPAQGDLVARLGGDEFGILLPALSRQADVMAVVDKLLLALREPFLIDDQHCSVGLSIGAAFYPTDAADLETLIGLADAAMYAAKRSGVGCVFAGSAAASATAASSP